MMTYDSKLLEEYRKYGAVTCSICRKRNRKNWNIYSTNTFCSQECISRGIDKLLSKINEKIQLKNTE